MQEVTEGSVPPAQQAKTRAGVALQLLRFFGHLAAVYIVVNSVTPWFAGWTRHTFLPLVQIANTSTSDYEFFCSNLLAFSFVPALVAGLSNLRFKHRVAEYVWVVPAVVLAYKLATFSVTTSVFAGNPPSAFYQYFGNDFLIPEYRNWQEFWEIVRTNPDMMRGLAQVRFTAPFYAGVGYSLSAGISLHTNAGRKINEMVTRWEEKRFGGSSSD